MNVNCASVMTSDLAVVGGGELIGLLVSPLDVELVVRPVGVVDELVTLKSVVTPVEVEPEMGMVVGTEVRDEFEVLLGPVVVTGTAVVELTLMPPLNAKALATRKRERMRKIGEVSMAAPTAS